MQRYKEANITAPHAMNFDDAAVFITTHLQLAPLEPEDFAELANSAKQAKPKQRAKDGDKKKEDRKWCYVHGNTYHTSEKCNFMRANPTLFTASQRIATQADITGGKITAYVRP